jgi:hypothetical protein
MYHLLLRFKVAIAERWRWLLLPLAVTLLYVGWVYTRPYSHDISARVVAPEIVQRKGLPAQPLLQYLGLHTDPAMAATQFFTRQLPFAAKLQDFGLRPGAADWRTAPELTTLMGGLTLAGDRTGFTVRYRGTQRREGENAVTFLAAQLAGRMSMVPASMLGIQGEPTVTSSAGMMPFTTSAVESRATRYRLTGADLRGAAQLLIVSLVLVLLGVFVNELLNRTLTSEMQLALYLGVPVLGRLPRVAEIPHPIMRLRDEQQRQDERAK